MTPAHAAHKRATSPARQWTMFIVTVTMPTKKITTPEGSEVRRHPERRQDPVSSASSTTADSRLARRVPSGSPPAVGGALLRLVLAVDAQLGPSGLFDGLRCLVGVLGDAFPQDDDHGGYRDLGAEVGDEPLGDLRKVMIHNPDVPVVVSVPALASNQVGASAGAPCRFNRL
jgi:hypothetical protein